MATKGSASSLGLCALVFLLGAGGAWLRDSIFVFLGNTGWALVFCNALGSFLLGLVANNKTLPASAKTVLGQGLCGALTTMSGFSLYLYHLYQNANPVPFVLWLIGLTISSFAAFTLGKRLPTLLRS